MRIALQAMAIALPALSAVLGPTWGQAPYPNQPVRFVIAFGPGGVGFFLRHPFLQVAQLADVEKILFLTLLFELRRLAQAAVDSGGFRFVLQPGIVQQYPVAEQALVADIQAGLRRQRNFRARRQKSHAGLTKDVHDLLHLFPAAPSHVLDIGAGTGRDAAAFARLGHTVTAVEPTPELRAHAHRLHGDLAITWIDDSLPDLDRVHAPGERYDLVMLTAVWMHLDKPQRAQAMARVAPLVRPDGVMVLSLRHGPMPAGRRMFEVSAAETRALAARHGLATIHDSERPALLGGPAVWWSRLAFRRQR